MMTNTPALTLLASAEGLRIIKKNLYNWGKNMVAYYSENNYIDTPKTSPPKTILRTSAKTLRTTTRFPCGEAGGCLMTSDIFNLFSRTGLLIKREDL